MDNETFESGLRKIYSFMQEGRIDRAEETYLDLMDDKNINDNQVYRLEELFLELED